MRLGTEPLEKTRRPHVRLPPHLRFVTSRALQCWAFSTVEEIETDWIMAGNSMVELSPQQIVSCDTGDDGCNGGDTVTAYAYVESAGLETEADYPYTYVSRPCSRCLWALACLGSSPPLCVDDAVFCGLTVFAPAVSRASVQERPVGTPRGWLQLWLWLWRLRHLRVQLC